MVHYPFLQKIVPELVLGKKMASQLEENFVVYARALNRQGILDTNQFGQLQMCQDENDPQFVREIVGLFFDDSERLLNDLSKTLDQLHVDFKIVGEQVHELKGKSSSIGAQRVRNACDDLRDSCEQQNRERCHKCFGAVNQEFLLVKKELQYLFQMEELILNAGGKVPIVD